MKTVIIIGVIVIVIISIIGYNLEASKNFNTKVQQLIKNPTRIYSSSLNEVISYHKDTQEIRIYSITESKLKQIIKIEEIIEAKIVIDGKQDNAGNILLGGIVAGTTGALLSGIASNIISEIKMQFVMNNIDEPLINLNFISTPHTKHSSVVKNAIAEIDYYAALIKAIKNKNNN
jgi:hypothetical protein